MDAASVLIVLAAVGVTLGSQPTNDAPQPAPTRHTSYFAGQAGWGPERNASPSPAAAPTYDRYNMPTTGAGSTVAPPPSVVDRTRAAVTESGNALRDGVEAGIQAANQQLYQGSEQVIESTRSAGQEFSQQFQGWAGTAAQQTQAAANNAFGTSPQTTTTSTSSRQQVSNPFATAPPAASAPASAATRTRSGIAPPPWASGAVTNEPDWPTDMPVQNTSPRVAALGSPVTQTEGGGWTSVSSTIAPPPLIAPRLVNTPVAAASASTARAGSAPLQPMVGGSGPGFPAAITANQPVDRSVLAQPQQPPAAAAANENWDIGWGGNAATQPAQPATIGGRYDTNASTSRQDLLRDRDFGVGTQPVTVQPQGQPAATPGLDPWADKDPWGDERSKQAGAATGPIVANPAAGSVAAMGPSPGATASAMPAAGTATVPGAMTTTVQPGEEQVPWVPMLVVSLSLAGSIGANLFLGWSYMDARQKYRHLVQKTANKFRRAVAA